MTKRFEFTLAGATHVDMQQKTVKNAFTLAEVLITLGIIGVVAAMTMPTLMNSTQGAQYKAAYKKALSALSQAVTLNMALEDWNFADATADSSCSYPANSISYILHSRMNAVRCENGSFKGVDGNADYSATNTSGDTFTPQTGNTTFFFNDGIMFSFDTNAKNCTEGTKCKGFIDVNGIKGPNKIIKCDNSGATDSNCEMKNPTDVYPVVFYDQTVLPNSVAAKAVLYGK